MKEYKNLVKPFIYIISLVLIFGCLIFSSQTTSLKKFISGIENRTFDLRQNIICKYKKPNEDLVILAIDNVSYEVLTNEYGSWPVPREYWGNLINELEKYSPKAIVFDMLFISNFKNQQKLIEAVNSNDNVFVGIDFDDYPPDMDERPAPTLPDGIKSEINNSGLLIKNSPLLKFTNSRGIVEEILKGTKNIGAVNAPRDDDGTIRNFMPFVIYKDEFYPNLALLAALKYLDIDTKKFTMKNNEIVLNGKYKIPFDKTGRVILNWYNPDPEKTFKYMPLYQFNKAIKVGDKEFLNEAIANKIVYVGATTTALSDIKTTPVSAYQPGVEMHTTFLNNILDNNLIKRTDFKFDMAVSLLLAAIVCLIIFKSRSILAANIEILILLAGYFILSVLAMLYFNYWVGVVLPFAFAVTAFVTSYVFKYLLKSKDYEQTYKLAVTDALTDMYNHRYFQEQMILNCQNSSRYDTSFSLILIDIDFFKKFNDTYGHQSGDAVLKQVAQAIKKTIRSTDIACRYGGEEMAVILTNTKKEEAILTAEKICSTIRSTEFILANGQKTNVTISLGVSTAPIDGRSPVELIEYADRCLYRAKEQGRNQVVSLT